jgi:hypothetical protein
MWVILGAVLLVWNLSEAPIAVLLDGVVQCTVQKQQACRVIDVPAGRHMVNTPEAGADAALRGKPGESPIEIQTRDVNKVCANDAGNKPGQTRVTAGCKINGARALGRRTSRR